MPHKDKKIRTLYMRKYQKTRRYIYKNKILNYKKEKGKCSICGWKEHPEILQFHHLDKNKKEIAFNTGHLGSHSWNTIMKEIEKCILICPNCHNWIHYNETEYFREIAKKYMDDIKM